MTLATWATCESPKKRLDIAAPVLLASPSDIFVTPAVSEPVLAKGTITVEGAERANCNAEEGDFAA